tara:strand:- start:11445 stop:12065 length:621 start_codon:yes stop_codon:yes gene_type:complete
MATHNGKDVEYNDGSDALNKWIDDQKSGAGSLATYAFLLDELGYTGEDLVDSGDASDNINYSAYWKDIAMVCGASLSQTVKYQENPNGSGPFGARASIPNAPVPYFNPGDTVMYWDVIEGIFGSVDPATGLWEMGRTTTVSNVTGQTPHALYELADGQFITEDQMNVGFQEGAETVVVAVHGSGDPVTGCSYDLRDGNTVQDNQLE